MAFLILVVIVVVSITPAYLLFRALPSTGNVGGTFQGLEIKLSGAFAGYFAVILLIFYHYDQLFPAPPPPSAAVWHLSGQIVNNSGTPIQLLDSQDFSFIPPLPQSFASVGDGNVRLMIPTEPREGGGTAWPKLVIAHKDLGPVTIPLDPSQLSRDLAARLGVSRDEQHKEVYIRRITLEPGPPYNPTGPSPKQISRPVKKNHGLTTKKVNP